MRMLTSDNRRIYIMERTEAIIYMTKEPTTDSAPDRPGAPISPVRQLKARILTGDGHKDFTGEVHNLTGEYLTY